MHGDERAAARLRAYRLMEALQSDRRDDALAGLDELTATAAAAGWADVGYLTGLGRAMARVISGEDPGRAVADLDELVASAVEPALLAHALGLRAIVHVGDGDTEAVLADTASALSLLDLPDLPALDACTALVVCAAAYNALSLWELVDALYDRAVALESRCPEPVQAAAVAMNRVVIRLEWASSLLEEGDADSAREVFARAADAAAEAARLDALPAAWRVGISAAQSALVLYLDPPADPTELVELIEQTRADVATLRLGGDVEMLPLVASLGALALLRIDRVGSALSWLEPGVVGSTSSGARSFPLWVRARALQLQGDGDADPAASAYRSYAELLVAQRRAARRTVLAAARSRIGGERTTAERDRLAIDVALDPLTGLANRRALDTWLEQEVPHPRLTAVMLVDLDNFKAVNDHLGHVVGDDVLREVGRILTQHIRQGDLAIRVGGDEFAVILTAPSDSETRETDFAQTALARAAALRTAIGNGDWPETVPQFGASLGVAVGLLPASNSDAGRELYRTADQALYVEKSAHRATP